MVQDLLNIIEGETTEDSKTTIQPDTLRPHQSASSSSGEDHRGKTGESDKNDTSEERSTKVQVFLLLGGGTDKSNRAHHTDSVEASASENRGVHEHQRGQKSSLGQVEQSPAAIFHNVADMAVSNTIFEWQTGEDSDTYLSGEV